MITRFQCVGCGKVLVVDSAASGRTILCSACGRRMEAPARADVQPALPAPLGPLSIDLDSPFPAAAPGKGRRAPMPISNMAVTLTVLGCLLAVGVTWYLLADHGSNWEETNRAKIISLKTEAEDDAINRDYEKASQKYQELSQLVAGQSIKDADLLEIVKTAGRDQATLHDRQLAMETRRAALAMNTNKPAPAGDAGDGAPTPETPPKNETPPTPVETTPPVQTAVVTPPPATAKAPVVAVVPTTTTTPSEVAVTQITPVNPPTTEATTMAAVTAATTPWVASGTTAPTPVAATQQTGLSVVYAPNPFAAFDGQATVAMNRGVDFILSQFKDGELVPGREVSPIFHDGLDALCVYSLLEAGRSSGDPRLAIGSPAMIAAIEKMKSYTFTNNPDPRDTPPAVYGHSFRAAALALYNRKEDRSTLEGDVKWLVTASRNGAYTYGNRWTTTGPVDPSEDNTIKWDNSNSQIGLFGVAAGADVGVDVPAQYWKDVQTHWASSQLADGRWSYLPSTYSADYAMSAGGVASLFVVNDYVDAPSWGDELNRPPFGSNLTLGLAWLDKGDDSVNITVPKGEYLGFSLFALERAGLASGMKRFGGHDWFLEITRDLMKIQAPSNGSWGRTPDGGTDNVVDTAYVVAFLAKGRNPVTVNKLKFDGAWANRPRDMANLTRFVSQDVGRPLNWGVVSLKDDWRDWTDSPVLYLASHTYPAMDDKDIAKLHDYVEAGGMLFTQADGGSDDFNKFAGDLAKKMYPDLQWAEVPADDPIYSVKYVVNPKPQLFALRNGSRILMLHSPKDLSPAWEERTDLANRSLFEMGENVFAYATGKGALRGRISSFLVPEAATTDPPVNSVTVARLKYDGGWNPEPAAWPNFVRFLRWDTDVAADLAVTDLADIGRTPTPVAHVMGSGAYTPTVAEVNSMVQYVQGGGILLVDSAGATDDFARSIEDVLGKGLGATFKTVGADHPILSGPYKGMTNLGQARLAGFAGERLGAGAVLLEMARSGKGCVIVSHLDVTSGLLGVESWGVMGFEWSYSQELVRNITLWTLNGAKD